MVLVVAGRGLCPTVRYYELNKSVACGKLLKKRRNYDERDNGWQQKRGMRNIVSGV